MRITRHGAAALALLLTACGGGSGDGADGNGAGTGGTVVPAWNERIEPFEPKAAPARTQAAAGPPHAMALYPGQMPVISLGPLPLALRKAASAAAGAPQRIGRARAVAATASASATAALLQWQPAAQGAQVAALRFVSEGARGLRLGVLVHSLPPGTVLRFYGLNPAEARQVDAQALQAAAERNARSGAGAQAAHTYWGPDSGADHATLEVQIPPGALPQAVQLAVPRLSHMQRSAAEADEATFTKAAGADACLVDVSCEPQSLEQSRSVARMTFVAEDGDAYYCTATLLNDRASSGTPYLLTAQHCITSQVVASTLETDWLYRSASCGAALPNPASRRLTGGATLLYASAVTDTAFMRLHATPPVGVVYVGSYYGGVPVGQALVDVHHAHGDLQKFSLGSLLGYSSCAESSCNASGDAGDFLRVGWQQGSTAPGSSGSGIFVTIGAQRYLAGQLHGGTASCARPDGVDFFGRFDRSYRAALRRWLSP